MFGSTGRIRRRDGWQLLSGSERRQIRKYGGISNRQLKRVTKMERAYKKGKPGWRGRLF